MSTYQFFIILHGLQDVLVWLVPLLIAVLVCATAVLIAFRWIRERRSNAAGIAVVAARLEEIELRLAALEKRTDAEGRAEVGDSEATAE